MPNMELVSVAAVGDDLAIGADDGLPWDSLPKDKAQYRRRVAGSIVILGRRTFESMQGISPG
jgi:dihydrofolate reductase (EC 1.5.1.3)